MVLNFINNCQGNVFSIRLHVGKDMKEVKEQTVCSGGMAQLAEAWSILYTESSQVQEAPLAMLYHRLESHPYPWLGAGTAFNIAKILAKFFRYAE